MVSDIAAACGFPPDPFDSSYNYMDYMDGGNCTIECKVGLQPSGFNLTLNMQDGIEHDNERRLLRWLHGRHSSSWTTPHDGEQIVELRSAQPPGTPEM